jgi:large subunit ribosomal protein L30
VAVAARRTAARAARTLRVTWVRSAIGHNAGARGTIRALGLHRLNQSVEIADTPENRGMLRRVAFLLEVEDQAATGDDGTGRKAQEGSPPR